MSPKFRAGTCGPGENAQASQDWLKISFLSQKSLGRSPRVWAGGVRKTGPLELSDSLFFGGGEGDSA